MKEPLVGAWVRLTIETAEPGGSAVFGIMCILLSQFFFKSNFTNRNGLPTAFLTFKILYMLPL